MTGGRADSIFSLCGRTALVTGASSGLGAHFACVLAEAGAAVVLCARRRDRVEHLAAQLRGRGHQAVAAVVMDVADESSITRGFDRAEELMGGRVIDLLVNNAGIALPARAIETGSADWDLLMGTNLRGAFLVAQQACTRLVAAQRAGSVVNISSILAQRPGSQQASYGASKAALDQLTRVMAVELARSSIRVNGLAPGYFATEMNGEFFETSQGRQYIQRRFVTKRLGQLHELDGALLLLASEAGSYITGQTLAIDGGHLQSAL